MKKFILTNLSIYTALKVFRDIFLLLSVLPFKVIFIRNLVFKLVLCNFVCKYNAAGVNNTKLANAGNMHVTL